MTTIDLECRPTHLVLNRHNNLFAYASTDLSLTMRDALTLKIVRKFDHVADNQITAVTFSSDSKRLFVAARDKTLKIYDILTSGLVDHVAFPHTIRAMAYSPQTESTFEFLATSHVSKKGIYLWSVDDLV